MLDFLSVNGVVPIGAETGSYFVLRVVLTYFLATFASYTALLLAHELVTARTAPERRALHIGGALVLGTGIWSALFMALLSYRMGIVKTFDPTLSALCWMIAAAVAYGLFEVVARDDISWPQILVGGAALGLGICAMQYTGIAAMGTDADVRYLPGRFVLSVAIAVGSGCATAWAGLRVARLTRPDRVLYKLGAALAGGAAIFVNCYVALGSAVFLAHPGAERDPTSNQSGLTASIMGASALILLIVQALAAYRAARSEFQLQDNEAKLRAVIDNALDALITIDAVGLVESFNPTAENLFGYTSDEVIGRNVKMLMPEPHRSAHDRYLAHYAATAQSRAIGQVGRELHGRRKDGSTFPIDLSVAAFTMRDGPHYSGVIRDISARKETEARLRESVERAHSVVEGALDAIISIDDEGIITEWNHEAERTFGWPRHEAMGRAMAETIIPRDNRAGHHAGMRRFLKDGSTAILGRRIEMRAQHRSGRTFAVDMAVTVQKVQDRHFFTAFMRDISVQKSAEADRDANIQALEVSNRELDEFAYIVSHDLKEPLRGLRNHATFLMEDFSERLDDEATRRLQRIVSLGTRAQQLIDDLLFFSRLGRSELAVQLTDPTALIRDVEQTLDALMEERHARIVVLQPMPMTVCDSTRVREALRNLIVNALKYNDKPQPCVEIGCLSSVMTPQGAETGVFYVKDNGIGIPAEFHEEIFRMFKRLQSDNHAEQEGTGAGLTFVKKIVERHGGRIWLESTLGEGTTFFFTLPQPLSEDPQEGDAAAAKSADIAA
jgi:two-component system sensor kinase FixL